MKRRSFCRHTIAAGVTISLGGCEYSSDRSARTIAAVNGAGESVAIEAAAVRELAEALDGSLYLPQDDAYDAARHVWNGMIDKHPAMIAQCNSVEDVVNAVKFSRDRNLLVAVRGGGHSYPGKSTCDGGMMIDLSRMNYVSVDPGTATATVDGGALLAHLDGAAMEHGMLTTTGIVSHTGVGGFTLGGGMGRTDRLHGLAIDNLLGATVVTASGEVLSASREENPDLFWALRGGGGNFGVVTEFRFGLHPFDPTVYGGSLFWSFDQAKDLLRFWAEFNESLPDEANVEPQWWVEDDGPVIMTEVCWAGDHAAGERAIAPLAKFGRRLRGELGPVPYSQMQTQADAFFAHGTSNYLKSGFVVELTEDSIDAMIGGFEGDALPAAWFQHLGGAVGRVPGDATAFPHRDAALNFGISSTWRDPAENEQWIAAIRRYHAVVEPHLKGFYTNLNEDTEQKTWRNFGDNYARLVEAKNRYDPTNLFRLNPNVRPTV